MFKLGNYNYLMTTLSKDEFIEIINKSFVAINKDNLNNVELHDKPNTMLGNLKIQVPRTIVENEPYTDEDKMYDWYLHDENDFFVNGLTYYTFSTDYFSQCIYDYDLINNLPTPINKIFICNYILEYRENENGRIKFMARDSDDNQYLKYLKNIRDYSIFIDAILLMIPKDHNPYKLFNKDDVKEIIDDLMDFKVPEKDTKYSQMLKIIDDEKKMAELGISASSELKLYTTFKTFSETLDNESKKPF